MIDTLTPEEQALIEEHRARKDRAQAEQQHYNDMVKDFEPSHVAMKIMGSAGDGYIAVPQTTDGDSGARYTNQCALAWRIFGSLVFWGHITVDFTKPDWAQQVKFAINNITAELIAGYHAGS